MAGPIRLIFSFWDTLRKSRREPLFNATLSSSMRNKIYKEQFCSDKRDFTGTLGRVVVVENTTFAEATKYCNYGKTAVLNFANPEVPGGGVTTGSTAQEECLCRSSNLYPVIKSFYAHEYYSYNRKHRFTFTDRIIYSPDIYVFKTDDPIPKLLDRSEWFTVDIITCAAPKYYLMKKNTSVLFDIFKNRITNILEVAIDNGVKNIILGAFGCGAFANPPEIVAQAFREVIIENNYMQAFDNIVFAIKKGKNRNFEVFQRELSCQESTYKI